MKEIVQRSLFGLIYVAVIVLGITAHPYAIFGLTFLFMALGYRELRSIFHKSPPGPESIAGLILMWGYSLYLYRSNAKPDFTPVLVFLFILMVISALLRNDATQRFGKLTSGLFSVLYLGIPVVLAPGIDPSSLNHYALLSVFILIWTNDTGAYLIGKWLGKHPMAPKISPKKSIEGLLGGLAATLLVAYMIREYLPGNSVWLIFGILVVFGATIGDLLESVLKRSAGVKDSGNLIPGHGGILDRIDSFLVVVPLVWLYLQLENWL